MKGQMRSNRNSGFTLVEVLATVGIIVILLAVATVSVIRYIDVLKIAELDNAAREIYMAAENRAVLLSGARRLDSLVTESGDSHYLEKGLESKSLAVEVHTNPNETLYYVSSADLDKELLTTGGIDPTLLDNGEFYIVYDLNSGSITDVFYAEKSETAEEPLQSLVECNADFETFYSYWADTRSERLGLKNPGSGGANNPNKTLVGWYNGEAAQSGAFGKDTSMKPYLEVMIDNREKLTVTVTARGEYVDYISALEVRLGPVLVDAQGNAAELDFANSIDLMARTPQTEKSDGDSYNCVWVLDSLDPTERQFKSLGLQTTSSADFTLGDDFMVTAAIKQDFNNEVFAWDVNNSLFQKGSGEGTAYIQYLRHLQNLDAQNGFDSGVEANIISAVQTANIQVYNNDVYPEYSFVPIYNVNLTAYDGVEREIQNLNVDMVQNSTVYTSNTTMSKTSLGLFRETRPDGMEFHGIRLVNATVRGTASDASVGALVGTTFGNAVIDNCWVYWEADGYVSAPLKNMLGSNEDGIGEYYYQLVGQTAGGLVGAANGTTKITGSLASTLIKGSSAAGGLVGRLAGSGTIEESYADCYLTGEKQAAGLVGDVVSGKTVELTNCYSAGFIVGLKFNGGLYAAGLCQGSGTTTTQYVYTVMQYLDPELKDIKSNEITVSDWNISYLTGHESGDTFHKPTGYLGSDDVTDAQGRVIIHLDYDMMTDRSDFGTGKGFADTMNGESGTGLFAWKDTTNSFPYNLRDNLTLSLYSYPGLKDLPHYGDWGAEFKDPSLVYYEHYSDTTWGISGGNAKTLLPVTLQDDKSILSDGYAVAFLEDDIRESNGAGTVRIVFAYSDLDENGNIVVEDEALAITVDVSDLSKRQATWGSAGSVRVAYLVPLPDELVYSEYARSCFYRYLRFELYLSWESQTEPHASGEFFYNPHFAETVKPYANETEGDETPKTFVEEYGEDYIETYANILVRNMGEITIRTPRHLYDLSRFSEYYGQSRYTFYQALDLDYGTYSWLGMDLAPVWILKGEEHLARNADGTLTYPPYNQDPIGKNASDYFYGIYNGGCNVIRNVLPKAELSQSNRYAGLFGYSRGTLQNIVYELSPDGYNPDERSDYTLSANLGGIAGNLYIGSLAGSSAGRIDNCAVYGVSMSMGVSGARLYAGGLVGLNSGTVTNSAAECAKLAVNSYSSAQVYIGGFVGENGNNSGIETSYAVGHIYVDANNGGSAVICGFAGSNSGAVSDSYAAMHLEYTGDGVTRYGFSNVDGDTGTRENFSFLDQGSFSYRGNGYASDYKVEGGSRTYAELSGDLEKQADGSWARQDANTVPMSGMSWVQDEAHSPQAGMIEDGEPYYPYPTAVTGSDGKPVHYGQWPGALPMGDFGVLYWEKLASVTANEDGTYSYSNEVYYFDALTVDTEFNKITERSTLSEAHDDGKVVTAYGYGYYYAGTVPSDFFTANGLAYFIYRPDGVSGGTAGNNDTSAQLTDPRINYVEKLSTTNSNYVGAAHNGYQKTVESSEELEKIIPGNFTVVSWDSYHEGGRPTTWSGIEENADRKLASTAGLVPDYAGKQGTAWTVGNGTFTLKQGGVSVTFVIDPHFAASMSVKTATGVTIDEKAAAKLNAAPGSANNPFQLRCGAQLQEINTSTRFYTDYCIGLGGPDASTYTKYWNFPTAELFPYLSSINCPAGSSAIITKGNTGWNTYYRYYYYVQTHDMDWMGEGNTYVENGETKPGVFTPIAAVSARIANNRWQQLQLPGWFAGSYDGGNYVLKNFNIDINTSQFNTTCMGLFGAINSNLTSAAGTTRNTTVLKNIVMYSESGKGNTITVRGRNAGGSSYNAGAAICGVRWYAGGVLVGAALGQSKIENCAVAGYTIVDTTRTAGDYYTCLNISGAGYTDGIVHSYGPDATEVSTGAVGNVISGDSYSKYVKTDTEIIAGAIGGLVGLTDGTLDGCVAVTTIQLQPNHSDLPSSEYSSLMPSGSQVQSKYFSAAGQDRPLRVGGLVGTITGNVTNCYTGGEIEILSGAKNSTIYIGRIIGGAGAGVFAKAGTVSVENCYSYMELPATTTANSLKVTTYNIGGKDDLPGTQNPQTTTQYDNVNVSNLATDYYLQDTGTATVTGTNTGTEATYQKLASEGIYDSLNSGTSTSKYHPVTSSLAEDGNGLAVSGRFSYVPSSYTELRDMDYPFPTVLTQKRDDVEGGIAYVHYGEWPIRGIKRDAGGTPIDLDLFTERTKEETLNVEKISVSGTWDWSATQVEDSEGNPIDAVEVTFSPGSGAPTTMTVTAIPGIPTPVTVTVTVKYYENGNTSGNEVPYTMDIPVNITANISQKQVPVSLYPYDTVNMGLEPDPDLGLNNTQYGYRLEIENVECVGGLLTVGALEDEDGVVTLTRSGAESSDPVWVDVTYRYTQYYDAEHTLSHTESSKTHRVEVTFLDLPGGLWTNDGGPWVWTLGFADELTPENYLRATADGIETRYINSVAASNKQFIVTMADGATISRDFMLTVTLGMSDGLEHTLIVTVPKPITEAELEVVPVEDESNEGDPDETGRSWIIDFSGLGLEDLEVEAQGLDNNCRLDFSKEDETVTITWDGTGEAPTAVTLNITLTKGDLKQICALTVTLSEDDGGTELDEESDEALNEEEPSVEGLNGEGPVGEESLPPAEP